MTRHDPDLTPLEELRRNVGVPFEQALAMPKSVYTSEAFAAQEREHIFAREWLCAGRADALPNPGDYMTMQISGEPIVVLRDRQKVADLPNDGLSVDDLLAVIAEGPAEPKTGVAS